MQKAIREKLAKDGRVTEDGSSTILEFDGAPSPVEYLGKLDE